MGLTRTHADHIEHALPLELEFLQVLPCRDVGRTLLELDVLSNDERNMASRPTSRAAADARLWTDREQPRGGREGLSFRAGSSSSSCMTCSSLALALHSHR
ncbi:unnamed protein product [Musa hybrid cultivar]